MARYRFVFYVLILVAMYIAGALIGLPGIEEKSSTEVTRTADGNEVEEPPAVFESVIVESIGDVEDETREFVEEKGRDIGNSDLLVGGEDALDIDPPADDFAADNANEAATAIAEQDQSSPREFSQFDDSAQSEGEQRPLMIRWSNWRPDFGPALVYARENDLEGMLRLRGPVEKLLMVTSYEEAERLMTRADELRAAGIRIVGLNSEDGPEMTPHEDMHTLDSPNPNENLVARVARLVNQHGFDLIWGPARPTADAVSDAALSTMLEAGMVGLALQEQKYIEVEPAQVRLAAVHRTRQRYLRLAQEQTISDFAIHVQIMHERCPDLGNCVEFVSGLEEIPVDSIAIWSNGPIPLDFISAIRDS